MAQRATRLPVGRLVAAELPLSAAHDQALCARLRELIERRRRFGCRRSHVLFRREGWPVNRKRVYRIYREEGWAVRRRKR